MKTWKVYPWSALACLVGLVFFTLACYPGLLSDDSIQQLEQSRSLIFTDALPPIMSWVWSKLNYISDGPQSLLVAHLLLLWSALYLWRRNEGDNKKAPLFILLGFVPWIACFEVVLWKDVGMAYCLLMGVGILSFKNLTKTKMFLVLLLFMYAYIVRENAPAALLPLIWYASGKISPKLSLKMKAFILVGSVIVMTLFINIFNYQILGAKKEHLSRYMMADDLVHISIAEGRSLFPGIDFEIIKECRKFETGETDLVGKHFCLSGKFPKKDVYPIEFDQLKKIWKESVLHNPVAYITFRLKAFFYLLRSPSEAPYYYWVGGFDPEHMTLNKNNASMYLVMANYINYSARWVPFFFKPYWWLLIGLFLGGATFRMKGDSEKIYLIRALLVSAFLYTCSYIPVTPMADFRYVYWSVIAINLSLVIFFTSDLKLNTKFKFK